MQFETLTNTNSCANQLFKIKMLLFTFLYNSQI